MTILDRSVIKPILLLTLAVPLAASAQVYKCQEGGRTVITDRPCHADAKPIEVKPATGAGDTSEYNSSAERARRDIEYARELDRRRAVQDRQEAISRDYDRRIEAINDRYDKRRCNGIQDRITRYEAHLRQGASARMYNWYKAEQAAAQAEYDRDCK
ncbi:MAG: hypothetical protein PWP11_871 [Thauera sp.]|nr:DUF4124 domain-containing protein [Thauera sp.]MDI3489594.1 hypothetical protein [Thauera sp.]